MLNQLILSLYRMIAHQAPAIRSSVSETTVLNILQIGGPGLGSYLKDFLQQHRRERFVRAFSSFLSISSANHATQAAIRRGR